MKDYYGILQVNPNASEEMIENAFLLFYNKYNEILKAEPENEEIIEKINDITEAYKILSDTFLRNQYDKEIEEIYSTQEENLEVLENETENEIENVEEDVEEEQITSQETIRKHKIGSFGNLIELVKSIFKKRKIVKKNLQREDIIAAGITVLVLIALSLILWNIPITNRFIRSQLFIR